MTEEGNGDYLYSNGGYVETLSSSGQLLSKFGDTQTEQNGDHTGAGAEFGNGGQAVQGPDGTIYTADPNHTIEATSSKGDLLGTTTFGGKLDIGNGGLALVGSTLYFQGGPVFNDGADNISSVPLATLQSELDAAHVPADTLGWGAGLATPTDGNYFAPGTTPQVTATFDPWWTEQASHLELSYTIENTSSLTAETVPSATTLTLPTSASSLASIPLTIPAADQVPGPYLVQASLFDTSTSPPTRLGTTCLPYTVGATGDGLNLSSLPSGIGAGGPTDPRGVALNSQLGLDGYRGASVNWSTFLPNCSASAPTAAACGPSAMTFTNASTDYYKAAATALIDHVTYWVQVSQGDSLSMALVNAGYWQGDIAALVRHYATVPSGCGTSAPVTMWEPWNEANNTGWGNAASYVSKVLAPFSAAVKSVEPGSSSTVIGGSSIDVAYSWWQQLVAAGGLADMDVAAIHPYPGSNDSFEEDGKPAQIRQLETLLGGKPLWFTEVGWWSDGDYNYLGQANDVARAMIWQKALSIPVWNYFFDEGNWGNWGVTFSLIQASNVDNYVKPSALASMTTSNEVAARPFVAMPQTGIPQTYEATFGPDAAAENQLIALWSDGLGSTGAVTVTAPGGGSIPVTVTTEYGQSTSVSVTSGTTYSLPVSDQVTYVTYPVGDTLRVGPPVPYGADLAAAASGGSATASSGNASAAIASLPAGYGNGWSSSSGDTTPSLTVTLANTSTIDRIVADTQSVGSVATSVRDYTVSVDEPGTGWTTVATEVGQYRDHEALFSFAPVEASAVKISVSEVDFGGYYGGGIPPWWSSTQTGTAFVHELQVFAGTADPSQVDGSGLTPLSANDPPPPPPTTTTTVPPTTTTTTHPPPTTTTTTSRRPRPRRRSRRPPRRRSRRPPRRRSADHHHDGPADHHHDDPADHHDHPAEQAARATSPGSAPRNVNKFRSYQGYWVTTATAASTPSGRCPSTARPGPQPQLADRRHGLDPRRQGLPDGLERRRHLHLRRRRLLRLDRLARPQPADGRDGRHPRRQGLLAGRLRRGHLRLRRRGLLRLDRIAHLQQVDRRHAVDTRRQGLLAGRRRRGHLRLRRRGLLRFDRIAHLEQADRRAWRPPPTAGATGWSPPTVASSPSATRPSTARPDRSPSTGRSPAWQSTPDGNGYWLVATDGGVFSFGDARYYGSASDDGLADPAVAIT